MTTTRKPQLEAVTVTIPEVASLLGVSLIAAYALAKREDFPAIRIGKRIVIPRAAFTRWMENAAEHRKRYSGK